MTESRGVLALLGSRSEHEGSLRRVAASCGFGLEVADGLAAAVPPLREKTTRAVLVDGAAAGAERLCQMARVGRFPGDLVVLVGAKKPDDASFAQAYDWGADDVVSLDSELALSVRLARLPHQTALPPRARGGALVAEPDPRLAARVERLLGYAGYDVECATELEPSHERAPHGRTDLVLLSSELGNPMEIIRQLRESGSQAVIVVWSKPDEVEPLTRALGRFDRVAVLSQRAPVESVLFLSNQLMTGPRGVVARTERRFLYGTTVAFREAGEDEDDYGFTYNVGPGGIYVRTLAVPAQASVWIELRPPGGHRRVRLAGEVVWRRPFGFASDALAPAGFGMRVSAGLFQDYERWLEDLARAPTGVHAVAPSRMTRREDAADGPASAIPDSTSGETDSVRWFSTYVAPSPEEEAFESSVRAPRRRPGAARTGMLVAALPALLVSAATVYLYTHSHPGLLPSSMTSRAREGANRAPRAQMPNGAHSPSAAAASATGSTPTTPTVSVVPSADGSSLAPGEGYLSVTSSANASVYVNGRSYGAANQPLRVPCGLRFVRLGEPPGPRWVSPGHTVSVTCRGFTVFDIQPETPRDSSPTAR